MVRGVNQFGRQAGRGIRPWLLILKILCFAIAVGSLVSALVLWAARRSAGGLDVVDTLHLLLAQVMVPALSGAIFFGLLLLLQHPGILLRQRWLRVKLILLACSLPVLHVLAASQLDNLRTLLLPLDSSPRPTSLPLVLGATIVVFVIAIFLGRIKPRLGQNWGKDYPLPRR